MAVYVNNDTCEDSHEVKAELISHRTKSLSYLLPYFPLHILQQVSESIKYEKYACDKAIFDKNELTNEYQNHFREMTLEYFHIIIVIIFQYTL